MSQRRAPVIMKGERGPSNNGGCDAVAIEARRPSSLRTRGCMGMILLLSVAAATVAASASSPSGGAAPPQPRRGGSSAVFGLTGGGSSTSPCGGQTSAGHHQNASAFVSSSSPPSQKPAYITKSQRSCGTQVAAAPSGSGCASAGETGPISASPSAISPTERVLEGLEVHPVDASHEKKNGAATTAAFPSTFVEDTTEQHMDDSELQGTKDEIKKNSRRGPLKVLFLSADTGGGHRASAESLAKQFLTHFPGTTYDLLDVWTEDGCLPYRTLVPAYKHLSCHPRQWRFLYHLSNTRWYEWLMDQHSYRMNEKKIRNRIRGYNPDVVVSVHPAMNYTPMRAVEHIGEERGKHIPFFTVVTDYGTGHCTWFQKDVEKCYVASDRITDLAKRRGNIPDENLVRFGLPIRQDFDAQAAAMGDRTTEEGRAYQRKVRHELGLDPRAKTVLVMGGGEGVGALADIVDELYATFTKRGIDATVAVVCGRNEKLRKQLRTRDWEAVIARKERPKRRLRGVALVRRLLPSRRARRRVGAYLERKRSRCAPTSEGAPRGKVKVVGLGFVTNMAEFMVASDVLVTKAGPGTIAEAAAVGLPVMLTSFLPGQEAGNVDVVLDGNFGAYCKYPEGIADEVSSWLADDAMLEQLSRNAQREGHPHAAANIVLDIGERTHRWMEANKQA